MQLEVQLRLCQTCLWCCRSGKRLFSQSHKYRTSANYYEVLGVKSDATVEEIKQAFFVKSKKLHPDSDPSNPELHNHFVKLNEAYKILSKKSSRKEYDLKFKLQYNAPPAHAATSRYTYHSKKKKASFSSEAEEDNNYWEQFRQYDSSNMLREDKQKRKTKNFLIMGYCLFAVVLSVGLHALLFSNLEEIHNNYMDEKDRVNTALYNQSKETARINSFNKQMEILRQNHAAFMQKYHARRGGDE